MIRVPAREMERMRSHGGAAAPSEACGALLGGFGRGDAWIAAAVALPNEAADPGRGYAIGPRAVLRLERAAARAGLELLGFYHTHPAGAALPSAADHAHALPGYVYLILPSGPAAPPRAWRLLDDRSGFRELPLTVAPAREAA